MDYYTSSTKINWKVMNKWSNYGKWRHPEKRKKLMKNIDIKNNTLDKQYTDLLQDILDNGVTKSDRTGTGTLSVFGRQIRHKMSEGFPLLTTKKMPFRLIATELMWFLRGDTNIKFLVDNNCHIWDGDSYKNYCKIAGSIEEPDYSVHVDDPNQNCTRLMTMEEFIGKIKTDDEFAKKWGQLGKIYGKQWRSWGTGENVTIGHNGLHTLVGEKSTIDQITNLINDLKTNPDSRRLMVNAWNVGELDQMVLPPCHYGFQVYTRELSLEERYELMKKLDNWVSVHYKEPKTMEYMDKHNIPTRAISLMWNQRSVDTFLGLPFNIASYGLLLEIIAKAVNMVPDELIGNLGDTHLYSNHIEQAKEQIGRELSLEERIELSSKDPVFDLGDFGVGEQVTDEHCHEICDSYSVPKKTREPFELPTLAMITNPDLKFDEYVYENFKLVNYQSHPSIKAPLSN
jgi:thymidylate synthase